MLGLAPTFVFVLALLVGLLKGRYVLVAVAAAAWVLLALIVDAVTGTIIAADAPWETKEVATVLACQLIGWAVVLAASSRGAAEGSWWARSGRPTAVPPILETVGNFTWVFSITLLGILFAGAGILGGAVFCALFAGLLAAVLLFGLGAARTQPA